MITAEKLQYLSDTENRIYRMIDSCETHYHIVGTQRYIKFFENIIKEKFGVSNAITCNLDDYTLVTGVIVDVKTKLIEKSKNI